MTKHKPEINRDAMKEILDAVKSKILNSGPVNERVDDWGFPLKGKR